MQFFCLPLPKQKGKRKEPVSPPRHLSRLERLPGEIRNQIWRLVVLSDKHIFPTLNKYSNAINRFEDRDVIVFDNWSLHDDAISPFDDPNAYSTPRCRQPGLTMTSKHLRAEVLPIFLAENTFNFFLPRMDIWRTVEDQPRTKTMLRATGMRTWAKSLGEFAAHVRRVNLEISIFKQDPVEIQMLVTKSGCQVVLDACLGYGLRPRYSERMDPLLVATFSAKKRLEWALLMLLDHAARQFPIEPSYELSA